MFTFLLSINSFVTMNFVFDRGLCCEDVCIVDFVVSMCVL